VAAPGAGGEPGHAGTCAVPDWAGLRRWQAESLSRVAADDALQALSAAGLLPETITRRAAAVVAAGLSEAV
jgi:hypothetical protein